MRAAGVPLDLRKVRPYSAYDQFDFDVPTATEADCYALFQDDIEVARGLRAWCDEQFWPHGAGLVSLFTPRAYADQKAGWRMLSPGSRTKKAEAIGSELFSPRGNHQKR